jgi:hypothetical protein
MCFLKEKGRDTPALSKLCRKYHHHWMYAKNWSSPICRGLILGRNWDKSLKSFPPCYSQSSLLTGILLPLPPPPPEQKWFETGLNVKNLKSENSQDYAQTSQQNCTFMNSASVLFFVLSLHQRNTILNEMANCLPSSFHAKNRGLEVRFSHGGIWRTIRCRLCIHCYGTG